MAICISILKFVLIRSCIQRQDLNPRPLDCEYSAFTTRPWLQELGNLIFAYKKFVLKTKNFLYTPKEKTFLPKQTKLFLF